MRPNLIKEELKKRGLDMTRLAQTLGVPYGTVVNVVNGYRKTPRVQEAIASFLGHSREELFGDEGN